MSKKVKVWCHIIEEFVDNFDKCPPKCPDKGNTKRCPLC